MDMLVLTRKVGQQIQIGDRIKITVVRVSQNGVRIGVEAPDDMLVVREELGTGQAPSSREANENRANCA